MDNKETRQDYTPANIEVVRLDNEDIVTSSNMDPGGWVSDDNW